MMWTLMSVLLFVCVLVLAQVGVSRCARVVFVLCQVVLLGASIAVSSAVLESMYAQSHVDGYEEQLAQLPDSFSSKPFSSALSDEKFPVKLEGKDVLRVSVDLGDLEESGEVYRVELRSISPSSFASVRRLPMYIVGGLVWGVSLGVGLIVRGKNNGARGDH